MSWTVEAMGDNTRLEDYLNDKLQTFSDFDSIDALLTAVQSQQSLLQEQVSGVGSTRLSF